MEQDPLTEQAGKLLLEEIAILPEKDFRRVNMTGVMGIIAAEMVVREARASAEVIKAHEYEDYLNSNTDPRD